MLKDQVGQRTVKRDQPLGQWGFAVGFNLTIGDMGQPVSRSGDNAPSGCAKAGVKAKDDQPNFSSTSSGTS